ncbi:PP0621 family protein [Nitrosomonas sp.]|uniref:PP0621 family protein n=1 Tax=Nitrosomonas sp. TaxID=42353 RepID=UPI00344C9D3E
MIFKWLFLILLVCLIFWLFKRSGSEQKNSSDTSAEVVENMVRCAYCSVYLPQNESITWSGQSFCCAEHRRLFSQYRSLHK